MDPDTGRIMGGSSEPQSSLTPFEQITARIRYVLEDGELTRTQIRDKVSGRNTEVLDALDAMVKDGEVLEHGEGKKGDPHRYVLASSAAAQDSVPRSHPKGNADREPDSDGGPKPIGRDSAERG